MRYLLKDDDDEYHRLSEWIGQNYDRRTPRLDTPPLKAYMEFSKHDIELRAVQSRLMGQDFSIDSYLKRKMNAHGYDYVVHEFEIEEDKDRYKCYGSAYMANEDFISNYKMAEAFKPLINAAMKLFNDMGVWYDDTYIENGVVMTYDRKVTGMNDWEPANERPVMTEAEYDRKLLEIKNRIHGSLNP